MSDIVILATDAPWRGCAAKFCQPLCYKNQCDAQCLVDKIDMINCYESDIEHIVYRNGEGEKDIRRQVFRWDLAPHDEVFRNGFQVRRECYSPDYNYYNLHAYMNCSQGRPLDSRRRSSYAFISTTISNSWYPSLPVDRCWRSESLKVYRYEIYAPGGIWTSLTLGDSDNYNRNFKRLDEVAFVEGIAPQYIRSAQVFELSDNGNGSTSISRADNMLRINGNFNPQSHPLRLLNIENPICDYTDERMSLVQRIVNKSSTSNPNILKWYATDVANRDIYLSSAFRSSSHNEAYYILQNTVTQLNYDPGGGDKDFIVDGPSFISQMFPSLEYTPFGEHGIDAAFQLQGNQAIIFCGNLCALINYSPNDKNDEILEGPMTISKMFPIFKGTVFENGIDSACELKLVDYEAYIFKGNLSAHVRYGPNPRLIALGETTQISPVLKGTIFGGLGIDAAYASHHRDEQTYFFKYNNYGQINIKEDTEYVEGVWTIGANAPVINSFVPQKNRGLDMREDAGLLPNAHDYAQDEVYAGSCY